jgi:hypothetical protein
VGFSDPPEITGDRSHTNWDGKCRQPQLKISSILLLFELLSKAGMERIWIDFLVSIYQQSVRRALLTRSEYSFDFIFHKHSCCLYISIKCERNSRGMVLKSDTNHAIQSKTEKIERAEHTLQLACIHLKKSSAARFTSIHAKHCTLQISLPTYQHTRSVLASDYTLCMQFVRLNGTCVGAFTPTCSVCDSNSLVLEYERDPVSLR